MKTGIPTRARIPLRAAAPPVVEKLKMASRVSEHAAAPAVVQKLVDIPSGFSTSQLLTILIYEAAC